MVPTDKVLAALLSAEEEYVESGKSSDLFESLLDHIIKLTDSGFGYIAEIKTSESSKNKNNETGRYLRCTAISNISWDKESGAAYKDLSAEGMAFDNIGSIFLHQIDLQGPFITDDLIKYLQEKFNRGPTYPAGHPPVKTFTMIPIYFKKKLVGQVGLANRPTAYTKPLLKSIQGLIYRAGTLIQFTKMEAEKAQLIKQHNMKKAKNLFLANVSHELRTPLNTILGMISLMLETELDDNQYECLLIARTSCYQLLGLITEILDINKLEAGKMILRPSIVNIKEIIEASYDLIGVQAKQKGLSIDYQIDSNVPAQIIGDKQRLQQMLGNLLSNAVKFTKKGKVFTGVGLATGKELKTLDLKPIELYNSSIRDKLVKRKSINDISSQSVKPLYKPEFVGDWLYLKFSVVDTGMGVQSKDIDKLFQSFTQLDASNTKSYKGTGLGLAITNELCKLMGGNITLNSVYGEGSTFYFIIPVQEYLETSLTLDLSILDGKTFLVVDDNEMNLTRLTNLLDSWDIDYRECSSAKRALNYANKSKYKFDLGLLDIVMPVMDGNMLADRLARLPDSFPLIALSSKDEDIHETSSAFSKHLVKPYEDQKLLEAIVQVLQYEQKQNLSSSDSSESLDLMVEDDLNLDAKFTRITERKLSSPRVGESSSPRTGKSSSPRTGKSLSRQTSPNRKYLHRKKMAQIDNFYEKAVKTDINILVVEDIDYNRVMLTKMLQNIGYYNIDSATSGEEAISTVKHNRGVRRKRNEHSQYDLILMDIIMPGKYDGVQASKKITKMFSDIKYRPKIVAVTASVLDDALEIYQKEGQMDGHIEKPIDKIRKITEAIRPLGFT